MPPLKVCATPGCPELTTGAHCPTHTHHRHGRSTSRAWARLRNHILASNPICAICHQAPVARVCPKPGSPC